MNFSRFSNSMFQSDTSRLALHEIIQGIEDSRETQSDVDITYDQLCDVILNEMNETIPCYSSNKVIRKRYKYAKPYTGMKKYLNCDTPCALKKKITYSKS